MFDRNFYTLIAQSSVAHSAELAIRWPRANGSVDLTFAQLTQRVSAARYQLRTKGIQAGDVCLLAIPISPLAIVSTLALMAEGAIPMLPPARISLAQWRSIRKKYAIRVIITERRPSPKVRLLSFLSSVRLLSIAPPTSSTVTGEPNKVTGTQSALITFSSGSTGQPKAIERSHTVLVRQHEAILHHFPAHPGTLDFPLFPNVLLHNLAAGIGTVLPDIPGFQLDRFCPEKIMSQLQREAVRTLTGNVRYFTQLAGYAELQQIRLPKIAAVGVGGSPVPECLLERLQKLFTSARVYVIYGASEAEPIAVRKFTQTQDPLRGYAVGTIHPSLRWKVASTAGEETGELLVTGPHVALSNGTWFATGDVGYVSEGKLFLTARRGNETVVGGKQHYQLEHYLQHQSGIKRAAAVVNGHAFDIFFEGIATIEAVRVSLNQVIDSTCIKTIQPMNPLPTDRRHRSKILYGQLRS